MSAGPNDRIFTRSHVSATVKLVHAHLGELTLTAEDFSDGGAFILTDDNSGFEVGDEVSIQVIAFGDKASPMVKMQIMRITAHGIGLTYR